MGKLDGFGAEFGAFLAGLWEQVADDGVFNVNRPPVAVALMATYSRRSPHPYWNEALAPEIDWDDEYPSTLLYDAWCYQQRRYLDALFMLPDGIGWETVARGVPGGPTGRTVRNWIAKPERLDLVPDDFPRGRAVWLTAALNCVALHADGLGVADLFEPPTPEGGPGTWRLYSLVLHAVGAGGVADVEKAVAYVTGQDRRERLQEAVQDALWYVDEEALKMLRPLVADLLRNHPTSRGVQGWECEELDTVDDLGGVETFCVGPAQDARDNVRGVTERLRAWPGIPPRLPRWTDPRAIDADAAEWRRRERAREDWESEDR